MADPNPFESRGDYINGEFVLPERTEGEIPVEDPRERRARVESVKARPLDRGVATDERTGVAVAEEGVVADRGERRVVHSGSRGGGPLEPAGYSSIGTRSASHASSTGPTIRQASSDSSPRIESIGSPRSMSRSRLA